MYKVVAVEYLNTLPYITAFEQSEYLQKNTILYKTDPKNCAAALKDGFADIVLLPIGSIYEFEQIFLISPYGIACDGAVKSVGVFSQAPFSEVKTILKSEFSRSSNELLKLINSKYWNNSKKIIDSSESEFPDAQLIIGDKAMQSHSKFQHFLDLGLEWKKWTDLPFVFACWVSSHHIDLRFRQELNNTFEKHTQSNALKLIADQQANSEECFNYFEKNIQYRLTNEMLESMRYFFQLNQWKWNINEQFIN